RLDQQAARRGRSRRPDAGRVGRVDPVLSPRATATVGRVDPVLSPRATATSGPTSRPAAWVEYAGRVGRVAPVLSQAGQAQRRPATPKRAGPAGPETGAASRRSMAGRAHPVRPRPS